MEMAISEVPFLLPPEACLAVHGYLTHADPIVEC